MAYTIISQNNSTTTLSDENGNVITVPSRSILDAGTTFTLVKINNSTATLEGSNGKIYRDIPCCVDLTQVTGFTVTKVNNNKATLEDTDGNTYAGVPCIVNLTESGGGSSAVIDPLNVTPTTSAQTITASGGVDGYSPVNVAAVDASIDANITAGNIKKDVSILGVTGTYEGQTPTGSISITANGVYDVTDYASADVQVPTIAPAYYVERGIDANGALTTSNITSFINLTGVLKINSYVLDRAYASSNISATIPDFSSIVTISDNGMNRCFFNCSNATGTPVFSSLTTIGSYGLNQAFSGCISLTGTVNLNSLTTIYSSGLNSAFSSSGITGISINSLESISADYAMSDVCSNCTHLTAVSMSNLKTLPSNVSNVMISAFKGDSALISVDISNLQSAASSNGLSNAFEGCGLTSINLSNLVSVTNSSFWQTFKGCPLTSADLSSLANITGSSAFGGCFTNTQLTELKFPAAKNFGTRVNQFNNMCQGVTNITLHFPSNIQSTIEGLTGYSTTAPFGAMAGAVLFDLPSTAHLIGADTIEYERNPKYDTATALSWRVNGTMPTDAAYYTSGTTDPAVSDTIYSDSACTTAVTTISSIA